MQNESKAIILNNILPLASANGQTMQQRNRALAPFSKMWLKPLKTALLQPLAEANGNKE